MSLAEAEGAPVPTCRLRECAGPVEAKGLCRKHYRWERMYGDPRHKPLRGGPRATPIALVNAGVSKRQRDYWCATGLLRVETDPDTGRRQWTAEEVRIGVVLVRLTNSGIHLPVAVGIARDVVEHGVNTFDLGKGITLEVRESNAEKRVTPW